MSYSTISQCAADKAFVARVSAATVQEAWNNPTVGDTPYGEQVKQSAVNAQRMAWPVSTASDIEAAYASALAGGNPNPGGDESAITDGMILSAVQANWIDVEPTP